MENKFAVRMKLIRKEKGWSQKLAAANLGISQALLSHYEKGIRECGLDFIIKASEVYSVSCDYLLGATDNSADTVHSLPSHRRGSNRFTEITTVKKGCCRIT